MWSYVSFGEKMTACERESTISHAGRHRNSGQKNPKTCDPRDYLCRFVWVFNVRRRPCSCRVGLGKDGGLPGRWRVCTHKVARETVGAAFATLQSAEFYHHATAFRCILRNLWRPAAARCRKRGCRAGQQPPIGVVERGTEAARLRERAVAPRSRCHLRRRLQRADDERNARRGRGFANDTSYVETPPEHKQHKVVEWSCWWVGGLRGLGGRSSPLYCCVN